MPPGSSGGFTGAGSQEVSQATAGVPGTPEADDGFGGPVAILNLNGSGGLDAVIGTPNENVTGDPAGYGSGSDRTLFSAAHILIGQTSWTGRSLNTPDFNALQFGAPIAGAE